MAEKDWYGPFSGFGWHHWGVFVSVLTGAALILAGLSGYDTGLLSGRGAIPTNERWTGQIQGDEIALGVLSLGWAFMHFARLKSERKTPPNSKRT
jgi:hypothetical protein